MTLKKRWRLENVPQRGIWVNLDQSTNPFQHDFPRSRPALPSGIAERLHRNFNSWQPPPPSSKHSLRAHTACMQESLLYNAWVLCSSLWKHGAFFWGKLLEAKRGCPKWWRVCPTIGTPAQCPPQHCADMLLRNMTGRILRWEIFEQFPRWNKFSAFPGKLLFVAEDGNRMCHISAWSIDWVLFFIGPRKCHFHKNCGKNSECIFKKRMTFWAYGAKFLPGWFLETILFHQWGTQHALSLHGIMMTTVICLQYTGLFWFPTLSSQDI